MPPKKKPASVKEVAEEEAVIKKRGRKKTLLSAIQQEALTQEMMQGQINDDAIDEVVQQQAAPITSLNTNAIDEVQQPVGTTTSSVINDNEVQLQQRIFELMQEIESNQRKFTEELKLKEIGYDAALQRITDRLNQNLEDSSETFQHQIARYKNELTKCQAELAKSNSENEDNLEKIQELKEEMEILEDTEFRLKQEIRALNVKIKSLEAEAEKDSDDDDDSDSDDDSDDDNDDNANNNVINNNIEDTDTINNTICNPFNVSTYYGRHQCNQCSGKDASVYCGKCLKPFHIYGYCRRIETTVGEDIRISYAREDPIKIAAKANVLQKHAYFANCVEWSNETCFAVHARTCI